MHLYLDSIEPHHHHCRRCHPFLGTLDNFYLLYLIDNSGLQCIPVPPPRVQTIVGVVTRNGLDDATAMHLWAWVVVGVGVAMVAAVVAGVIYAVRHYRRGC